MIRWMIVPLVFLAYSAHSNDQLSKQNVFKVANARFNFFQSMTSDGFIEICDHKRNTVTIDHDDYASLYNQGWQMKHNTVHSPYKLQRAELSECSNTAKRLFLVASNDVTFKNQPKWKTNSLKHLLCKSDQSYRPVIANLKRSKGPTEVQKNQTPCRSTTLTVTGSIAASALAKRHHTCSEHRNIKGRTNKAMFILTNATKGKIMSRIRHNISFDTHKSNGTHT